MLFFGDYAHQPNPEAAERLVLEVLPRIRSVVPEAELMLAGANSHLIEELAEQPSGVVHVAV